jgi:hypothetical protein
MVVKTVFYLTERSLYHRYQHWSAIAVYRNHCCFVRIIRNTRAGLHFVAKYRLVRLSGKWVAKQVTVNLGVARGLRLGSEAARLLGLRFHMPQSMGECLLCVFVFSGTGLCVGLITRPEVS